MREPIIADETAVTIPTEESRYPPYLSELRANPATEAAAKPEPRAVCLPPLPNPAFFDARASDGLSLQMAAGRRRH